MNEEIAIAVQGVYKDFKLPHQKVNSIKSIFTGIHKKRTKSFETQHALKDISFEVKKGEFFGIVGRNGSGKSTLLKIIAEIYQPTKGTLQKSGKLVPFIELGVGFNPELTGRENVYLNGALLGFSEKEIDAQYDDIVDFAELEPFMDQKLKNYSSGMQVRLAFSVATRAEADILLIDEVLAVGDASFQKKCFEYFRSLKKQGKTVIFVSHDMNAVAEYCDRGILIEKSELIVAGSPEKIAAAYRKMFFDQESDEVQESETQLRWGDRAIFFEMPKLSHTRLTEKHTELIVTVTAQVKEDVENPLFGFSIKNSMGQVLLGTNNAIVGNKLKSLSAGEKVAVKWVIPNVFSDGSYAIDLATEYLNGREVADRWEEALTFEVTKEETTPYLITPSVSLELDRGYDT